METNKSVTAIEWFFNELQNMQYFIGNDMLEAYKQAKQIEKQQIIDAYDAGLFDGTMDDVNDRMHKQYYNETYGSKGSEEDLIDAINMARNEPDMSGDDIILSIKQSKPTSSQTESRKIM